MCIHNMARHKRLDHLADQLTKQTDALVLKNIKIDSYAASFTADLSRLS